MEVFYYRDPKLNFGDDLNAVLWPRILPREAFEADDIEVVGIGSILTQEYAGSLSASGKRIIVLGSGTSYDQPPIDIARWDVLAVRGPWTASMIGMPDKAVTDGAILLADTTDLWQPTPRASDVVFMPHHRSIRHTPWEQISREAGMVYVSPQQPVETILAAFARAKLVVTEAMHGAIVADTMRIPWIPVVVAPTVDEFKWRDWGQSVAVPFEPSVIPAGHSADRLRYTRMARILANAGVVGHQVLVDAVDRSTLQSYFDRRFAPRLKADLLRTGAGRIDRVLAPIRGMQDEKFASEATTALALAARREPYLSDDRIFHQRLDEMRAAVTKATRILTGVA